MVILKYNIYIDNVSIEKNLKRIINRIYKLLPSREEGIDWKKPLDTILEELAGMGELFVSQQDLFFALLCKLEGLRFLESQEKFPLYRRTIFECLTLLDKIKKSL